MSVEEYRDNLINEYGDTPVVYSVAMEFKDWLVENNHMEGDK